MSAYNVLPTLPATAGKLTSLADIDRYITAGDARFTLVSNRTNTRETFRVRATDDSRRAVTSAHPSGFFVDLLNGPDNTRDYKYLCFLYVHGGMLRLKHNRDNWGADSFAAFHWLVDRLNEGTQAGADDEREREQLMESFNKQAEVYHLGKCGRCGRDLTTPESVARGIGPVCAEGGRDA